MRFSFSAGRNGVSITLVTQYDIHLVHSIEEQTRKLLGDKDRIKRWFSAKCFVHIQNSTLFPASLPSRSCVNFHIWPALRK